MLVVISDLHFEEEKSDTIQGPASVVGLQRNVPARAFGKVFSALAKLPAQSGAKQLDLVLAGDIFDLHRTGLWFQGAPRPYVGNREVDAACEATILRILDAIEQEPEVGKTLEILRLLRQGRYRDEIDDPGTEWKFPVPVALHYLPGNHDRLLNSTPRIRSRVRALLGIPPSGDPFPHTARFDDPHVLIRHGHEYDRYNFSENYEETEPFPGAIPQAHYDSPTFGDFITLEVAAALPRLFRDEYGDARILAEPTLRKLYVRLLEFDDVRPQSELVDFLLHIPDGPGEVEVWDALRPVARTLLDRISEHAYLRDWLHRLGYDAIALLLRTKFWHLGFALDVLKKHASSLGSPKGPGCVDIASREASLPGLRFVIAGHTHEPQVAVVGPSDQYYVDTGTWRHRVFYRDRWSGRAKALTYVTVYASGEDRGKPPLNKKESFDFWTGYTARWEA